MLASALHPWSIPLQARQDSRAVVAKSAGVDVFGGRQVLAVRRSCGHPSSNWMRHEEQSATNFAPCVLPDQSYPVTGVMRQLPSGTVTLLFTDIVGSTRLLQELGRERYVRALTEHRRLLREAFTAHGGVEVEMQGDSFHFAFPYARDAVAAAAAGQRALAGHEWESEPITVRIGLHTGEPMQADGLYAGLDVHRAARVMSAGHGGQVIVSERTADLVEGELPEGVTLRDLGEHRLKDLSLPQRLYDLVVDGLPVEFPPAKTLENRPTNLPVQPTPLIGRARELGQLLLEVRRPEVRLLTLTGPGGTGKTRLALHAAAELVEEFGQGVFCVFLASVRDPSLVLGSVAQTLGVREQPGQEVAETLFEYLRERELLLVLDNFEHVVAAAPDLGALIARCERLVVLVTSRAPLHLSGEHEYPVPPLGLPEPAGLGEAAVVSQYEAVQLFVQRAQAVKPAFQVTNENAAAVAAICVRLDGLPLALELAAARVRLLSPQALLKRLDDALGLLSGGAVDAAERQRTLRATIAWSYDLLSAQEQTLFARLAVFAGGFRIEAAEQVCNPNGELGIDVLDGLGSLLEKSLLRQRDDPDGEPRFWMLETIRVYAAEQLEASGRVEETRDRHADWCLDLAERAEPELEGPNHAAWLSQLEDEHDNLRAALSWLGCAVSAERQIALIARLVWFWYLRGHFSEAIEWGQRVFPEVERELSPDVASALKGLSSISAAQGDYARALTISRRLLRYYESVGDRLAYAEVVSEFGVIAVCEGDNEAAVAYLERALEIARGVGSSPQTIAAITANLGEANLARGDHVRALSLAREAAELARGAGLGNLLDFALYVQALALLESGDVTRAAALAREALEVARAVEDKEVMMWALDAVAAAAARNGEFSEAARCACAAAALQAALSARRKPLQQRLHEDTLSILRTRASLEAALTKSTATGDIVTTLWCLRGVGSVAAGDGDAERAARVWGAADAAARLRGALFAVDPSDYDDNVAQVRTSLGAAEFERLWSEGGAMTPEEAAQYAFKELTEARVSLTAASDQK